MVERYRDVIVVRISELLVDQEIACTFAGADPIPTSELKTTHKNTGMGLYKDSEFIPSKWLDEIQRHLLSLLLLVFPRFHRYSMT